MSILLSACDPPFKIFIIGTGIVTAPTPPIYLNKLSPDSSAAARAAARETPSIALAPNFDLFGDAVNRALLHYNDNRRLIDDAKYGPCYIEQLSIHQILRSIDGKYADSSSAGKHFIFKDVPTLLIGSENYTPNIDDVVWPLVFKTINLCGKCNTNHKDELVFQSETALKSYLDNDFGGFMHATYMKWYDWMQAIILDNIRVRVGDQTLLAIHSYYRDCYPSYDLPVKSGGEKLYEKLTKFSFD